MSAFLLVLVDAVVFVSSSKRLVTPKVPRAGFFGAVNNSEAAFYNFSYSTLLVWPAEPLSLMRGPGVLAKAFATLVFVGAK